MCSPVLAHGNKAVRDKAPDDCVNLGVGSIREAGKLVSGYGLMSACEYLQDVSIHGRCDGA
jgi:hypothetical protein